MLSTLSDEQVKDFVSNFAQAHNKAVEASKVDGYAVFFTAPIGDEILIYEVADLLRIASVFDLKYKYYLESGDSKYKGTLKLELPFGFSLVTYVYETEVNLFE